MNSKQIPDEPNSLQQTLLTNKRNTLTMEITTQCRQPKHLRCPSAWWNRHLCGQRSPFTQRMWLVYNTKAARQMEDWIEWSEMQLNFVNVHQLMFAAYSCWMALWVQCDKLHTRLHHRQSMQATIGDVPASWSQTLIVSDIELNISSCLLLASCSCCPLFIRLSNGLLFSDVVVYAAE